MLCHISDHEGGGAIVFLQLFDGLSYVLLAERLEMPRDTRGVLVTDVETGEPAEEAGLRRFDVIVSVNGERVGGVDDFERVIGRFDDGDRVRLRVLNSQGYRVVVLRLN